MDKEPQESKTRHHKGSINKPSQDGTKAIQDESWSWALGLIVVVGGPGIFSQNRVSGAFRFPPIPALLITRA